jgi:hypothetical protein
MRKNEFSKHSESKILQDCEGATSRFNVMLLKINQKMTEKCSRSKRHREEN